METLLILFPQVNLKRPGQWKNGNPSLIQMKPVSFQSPCVQRREVLSIETAPAPSKAWASREHRQFSPCTILSSNPQGFVRATREQLSPPIKCGPHKCLRSPSSGYSQKCNVSCVVPQKKKSKLWENFPGNCFEKSQHFNFIQKLLSTKKLQNYSIKISFISTVLRM